MSPQQLALLRFLIAALRASELAVSGEDEGRVEALSAGVPALRFARDEGAHAAGGGLVWLGPGAPLPEAPVAGRVYVSETAAPFDSWASATRAWLPLERGAAGDPPGLALALADRPETAVLETLTALQARSEREAPAEPLPEELGWLIFALARARRSRRALDVGSGVGTGLLWLASGQGADGRALGVERDSARASQARRNLRRAGLDGRTELRMGELERLASSLPGPFDLVLLDEPVEGRFERLEALLPRLTPGALVLAHGGRGEAAAAARFHAQLQLHPRLRGLARLALGRGLTLAILDGDGGSGGPPSGRSRPDRAGARGRAGRGRPGRRGGGGGKGARGRDGT